MKATLRMDNQPFRLSYIPALDGLRGIAILLVMGFHARLSVVRGGFVGVDMFFVLSGFLITSVLIKEWETTRTISIRHFYMRRILRLYPALILMLIFVNIYALLFRFPDEVQTLQHDTIVTLLYLSNWGMVFGFLKGSYLAPTWSLAIEEQFYILFPWLLVGLLRRLSRHDTTVALIALALMSFAWRLVLVTQGVWTERLYYALDTRLDELLMGAVLAMLCSTAVYALFKRWMAQRQTSATVAAVGACCLIALISNQADIDVPVIYFLGMPLVILSMWVLIVYVITIDSSWLKRLFEWGPLVYTGKISYGLYLWHWIWTQILFPTLGLSYISPTMAVLGTALSFATATLSYYLLERPIMRLKDRFQGQRQGG